MLVFLMVFCFFFKQKTAYEMRISDWSSDVCSSDLPVIHPLLSQPVIEHCLAIPTWLQCAGGCDRSIARQAFKPDLPAKVIERRGKGSPQGFIYQIFYRFRSEESRVGKECVSPCRSRWSQFN